MIGSFVTIYVVDSLLIKLLLFLSALLLFVGSRFFDSIVNLISLCVFIALLQIGIFVLLRDASSAFVSLALAFLIASGRHA